MSGREFESPEIFFESLDRFVSLSEQYRNSSGLFLDAGLLLFEYGEEKDNLGFSKDVSLDITPPAIVRLLFQRETPTFATVIAFESESLNRFIKLGTGKPTIGDGKYTDDEPLVREATWSELRDFRRLFDVVHGQIRSGERSLRDPGRGIDRIWESIFAEMGTQA